MTTTRPAITTATYTDQTTGWTQRVEVRGPAVADAMAPDQTLNWTSVRNTYGEFAKVPDCALSDYHTEPPFLAPEQIATEAAPTTGTDAPFVMVRHGLGRHAMNEPEVVGFLTEHGMWESMQRHGLRFSELRAHIADVKAGAVVTADDGYEWRLAN